MGHLSGLFKKLPPEVQWALPRRLIYGGSLMVKKQQSIYTVAVHAGHSEQADIAAPAIPSIVPAVGFTHPTMQATDRALGSEGGSLNQPEDYIYARYSGPTQAAFEEAIASLEDAESAVSFSSGMAAIHAALESVVPESGCIVAADQLYGTTRSLLTWLAQKQDVKVQYADFTDLPEVQRVLNEARPQAVICEVLSNPLARVVRVDQIAALAKGVGAWVIIDSTFATPYLLQPLAVGADIVVHSATKFLNGHGDVLGGVAAGPVSLMRKVRTHRRVLGAMLGPFESWLALRGLRTLAIRMQQASSNAQRLAEWLGHQPQISNIYYPGLPTDPSHEDAGHLFRRNAFGAMLAFTLSDATRETAFRFVECLRVIRPVTSLGDVTTLISHPATASHRGLSPEQQAAQGISEGTLRLSVGIEDPDDLLADLAQAFQALS